MATMKELGKEIQEINRANGWCVPEPKDWVETPYKIPAMLDLVTSEVSEALEGFRHDDIDNFAEEMADTVIRILDLTTGLGLDIEAEILRKMEKNRGRGYRHGNSNDGKGRRV